MIRFPTSPWGLSPPVAFADSARSPSPPTSLRRVTQQEETHRGPKGPKEGALLRLLLGPPSLKKKALGTHSINTGPLCGIHSLHFLSLPPPHCELASHLFLPRPLRPPGRLRLLSWLWRTSHHLASSSSQTQSEPAPIYSTKGTVCSAPAPFPPWSVCVCSVLVGWLVDRWVDAAAAAAAAHTSLHHL